MTDQYSIERVEDALHDKSLSTKQISSLKSELYILKQELEKRERIIAEEYRGCLEKNGESYLITERLSFGKNTYMYLKNPYSMKLDPYGSDPYGLNLDLLKLNPKD
jgi:hypothetical protein